MTWQTKAVVLHSKSKKISTSFKNKGINKKEVLSCILQAKCTDSKESKFLLTFCLPSVGFAEDAKLAWLKLQNRQKPCCMPAKAGMHRTFCLHFACKNVFLQAKCKQNVQQVFRRKISFFEK
ncbi:MAG: hypothetical protein EOO35_00550 [Cyanobacteriota bacterium]|nr:MAG: hypothetical protein EOO35_00550 [Cyanobacteriota bacterium]